ncbi:sulfotransferase family protein [Myxococcus qinghaiensis]|uniref:sulfotransferase family protein n=1 Tax=Myxococcus qinghaiensis TaxID=2906758 RepID=UPI0020A745AD|nr:sulfotransferase family protein [Myxococcus qinghaiensis]MCP3164270.1 sulfotransferase family protein [Myxococcus qinghaiensis]
MSLAPDDARLEGWIPARIHVDGEVPRVDWCHLGDKRFTDPFFDETLERRLRNPFALLFRHQTSMETLVARRAVRPGLPVKGLVFHMSRCGSTLLAQLLAALPRHIVLSEASPVDVVLRLHLRLRHVTDEQRIEWLRAVVAALGQRRNPEEEGVFLKLDAWHVLELPLLQRAFPGVPWLFLYRDPVEVMASHQKHRGAHMLPGVLEPARVGLDSGRLSELSLEEYGARVLARLCEAGLRAYRERQGPARLLNYRQLQDSAVSQLVDLFKLEPTASEHELLAAAAARDAKNPVLTFEDDTQDKARTVSDTSRAMAERWVREVYDSLEAERLRDAAEPDRTRSR